MEIKDRLRARLRIPPDEIKRRFKTAARLRARRRGLHLGPQQRDGMSRLQGWIDPETRCYVEAASAAVRARAAI